MPKISIAKLTNKYKGKTGKRLLLDAIKMQQIVANKDEIAQAILKISKPICFKPGASLMLQDDNDNDIYLIINGKVSIEVNKRPIASRLPGNHVGEMALIDPQAKRSATVTATEPTFVLKISESQFAKLANKYPDLWRRIAVETANRLRERNKYHKTPHNQPVVFIGSSSEGLAIANKIGSYLEKKPVVVKIWADNVFQASATAIESLMELAKEADFAIIIFSKDDITVSRARTKASPRDNIIFELGLFTGAIGRERSFIVKKSGANIKIPSDLFGVNFVEYSKTGRNSLANKTKLMFSLIKRIGPI